MTAICHDTYDAACAECVRHDETCGIRCTVCRERMCLWFGPEPAANPCTTHDGECQSCNNDGRCPECQIERMRARAEAAWNHIPDDAPWIDPVREADIDTRAELRAEQDAYEYAQLLDREGLS